MELDIEGEEEEEEEEADGDGERERGIDLDGGETTTMTTKESSENTRIKISEAGANLGEPRRKTGFSKMGRKTGERRGGNHATRLEVGHIPGGRQQVLFVNRETSRLTPSYLPLHDLSHNNA